MALLAAAALLGPFAAAAQEHQKAIWKTHELDFQFMGFTSHYSCSGLQGDIRKVLLDLGAREDQLVVTQGACSGIGDRPSRISGAQIKVATLQPAGSDSQADAVDAYWKTVTIGGKTGDMDCELIEQVQSDLLPLFTTRNLKPQHLDCIPHQATVPAPRLTLEVLSVAAPAK